MPNTKLRTAACARTVAVALGCHRARRVRRRRRRRARPQSGPVELTFWTWAPDMDKVVDRLERARNPDIQVTVKQAGRRRRPASPSSSPRPRPATRPDLVQAEYQALPTLVSNDALADIAERRRRRARASSPTASGSRSRWAPTRSTRVPQDSGPMMFYYRADLFDQLRPHGARRPGTSSREAARDAARRRTRRQYLDHLLRQRPGLVRRPRPAGRRASGGASTATPGRSAINDARHAEGRRLLGRPGQRGRRSTTSRCTPRSGTRRSTTARRSPGSARSGRPGVLTRQRARHQGQVGDGAAAAVGRRRERHRQLGRLVHRRHRRVEAQGGRRRSSPPG